MKPTEIIAQAQNILARYLRAHEMQLIQDRDRLIHKDIGLLHEQVKQLTTERDALASQANALEQEKDAALHRLQASEQRERRLSERLASIAAITSDM